MSILPETMLRRIDEDPQFQVMTVDALHWIEPYTAQLIPAGIGRTAAAREWLMAHPDRWRDRDPLGRDALELVRVQHDLARRVDSGNPFYDPRFCLFATAELGLGWLNPCSGQFDANVQRQEGRITPRTLNAMAKSLVVNPDFRYGRLLDLVTLRSRAQAIVAQMRIVTRTSLPPVPASTVTPVTVESDELSRARQVQDQLLPDLPQLHGFDIGVHFTAHHGVSGDFYEALQLQDGRILFAVGDVSGHGMQAALVVATALKTLRMLSRNGGELSELISRFNDEIKPDLPPGEFLTMVAVLLDPETRECEIIRAGHHAPILANPAAVTMVRRCGGTGMAVGLATGDSFARTLRAEHLTLSAGDVLALYTDGLAEAENSEHDQFGEHRCCAKLLEYIESSAQDIADGMAQGATQFSGGVSSDDVTVLIIAALDDIEDE